MCAFILANNNSIFQRTFQTSIALSDSSQESHFLNKVIYLTQHSYPCVIVVTTFLPNKVWREISSNSFWQLIFFSFIVFLPKCLLTWEKKSGKPVKQENNLQKFVGIKSWNGVQWSSGPHIPGYGIFFSVTKHTHLSGLPRLRWRIFDYGCFSL